jgi:hypothetical protein
MFTRHADWRLAVVALAMSTLMATGTKPGLAQSTQVADLSRASCGDIRSLSKSDQLQLMAFLFAYYAGAAQRPVVDTGRIQASAQAMAEMCEKQPATPLIGEQARTIFLADPLLRPPEAAQGALPGTAPGTPQQPAASGQGLSAAPTPPSPASPAAADGKPRVQP